MSENNEIINVCFSCDDNYLPYTGVAIASILYNAKEEDKIRFYILGDGLDEENKNKIYSLTSIKPCEINFIQVDRKYFNEFEQVKTHPHLPLASFYRLKLSRFLPNISRVIYFDCDFVVCTSLRELFDQDLGNCIIGGVLDINKRKVKENPTYINSGMIVFDLDKIREQNIEEQFKECVNRQSDKIRLGDQDIINVILKDKIKLLEGEWNLQSSNFVNRSSFSNTPKAIHLLGKPWKYGSLCIHKKEYFKYLQMTPWAKDKKDIKNWTIYNEIVSDILFIKRRPLFFLRPHFYIGLYYKYIDPIFIKHDK